MSSKFTAGSRFPALAWPTTDGGTLDFAHASGWRMLVVYRGKHCGLCKKYLDELNALVGAFKARAIEVAAVSADARDRAEGLAREQQFAFPLAYGLSVADMHALGLYVSPPSPPESDRPFAEPALFVINPRGEVQVVSVSNAPFARADLRTVLQGLEAAQDEHAPIHGTAT